MARAYMNHVQIAGNIVRPGRKMFTKMRKPYVLFTVAVERDKINGKENGADFINCCTYILWHQPLLLTEQVKGRQVLVLGRLNCWARKQGEGEEEQYKTGYQIVTDRLVIIPPLDNVIREADNMTRGDVNASEEGRKDDEGEPPF